MSTQSQPPYVPGQPQGWGDIAQGAQQQAPYWPPAPVAPTPDRTGPWVALAAGAAAILGSLFLPWVTVAAPIVGSQTLYGTEGDGWFSAAAAAVLLAYGIVALRRNPGIVFKTAAIVSALGVAGMGVWKVVDLNTREAAMRSELAGQPDVFGLQEAMSNAVQVQIGAGLWVLILAGLAGAVVAARALWHH